MSSLIEQANPLKLKNEDGTSKVYHSLKFAYYDVLGWIYALSAITFIDVEYVISRIYQLKYSETHHAYLTYFRPLGIETHVALATQVREKKQFYRNFIRAMHNYCGTHFDTYQFDAAFMEFSAALEAKPIILSTKELEEKRNEEENDKTQ